RPRGSGPCGPCGTLYVSVAASFLIPVSSRTTALPARIAALGGAAFVSHGVVLHDLALEHPHLDPDDPVGGRGFGNAIVDVRTQGMQRHAAFAVPFGPCDVGAAEATAHIDADALGAHAHRRLHGALHGPAERHAAFELLGDALGDERRIGFRLAHFNDVD